MIRIHENERAEVLEIVYRWLPGATVKAFGSRTRPGNKKWSDLDLAIMTDTPIAPDTMMKLKLDFSGSDLPWRVDILDWSQTSEAFRQSISAEMKQL